MKTRKEKRRETSAYWWQKILGIASITYLIVEVSIVILIFSLSFIGIKTMHVVSESMVPVYEIGDLILTTENYNGIAVDDIVIFDPPWFEKGSVVHRVKYIDKHTMITKGDNNSTDDPKSNIDTIRAEVISSIPKAGFLLNKTFIIISSGIALVLYFLSTMILRKEYWQSEDEEENPRDTE